MHSLPGGASPPSSIQSASAPCLVAPASRATAREHVHACVLPGLPRHTLALWHDSCCPALRPCSVRQLAEITTVLKDWELTAEMHDDFVVPVVP